MKLSNASGAVKGALLALVSALAYASSLVLSANAFDYGMAPVTMTLMRFVAVVIAVGVVLVWRRGFVPILSVNGRRTVLIGLFHFTGNLLMMWAVSIAPVSVCIVLFYMFPAIVLLVSSLLDRQVPSLLQIVTIGVAICGVALTVQPGDTGVNTLGVVLALCGACMVSVMMVGTQRLLAGVNPLATTFNLALTSVVLGIVVSLLTGTLGLPDSGRGALVLLGVMLLYPIALICVVHAIGLAGAVTIALVLCIEPVLTVLMAVVFRGETLNQIQILGMTLVISAIVFLQWRRARDQRDSSA